MRRPASSGTSYKHSKSKATTSKHNPKAKRKKASPGPVVAVVGMRQVHAKPARLSPGDVAACSAEAVAASLRIAGGAVSDSAVLGLFRVAGGHAERGAPILALLEAVSAEGLAGHFPVSFGPVDLDDPQAVILGLDLPGARHAVTAAPDGSWLSWGRSWDPAAFHPDAVITEAWAVAW